MVLLAGYGWRLLILGAVVVATYRVLAELWVLVLTVVVALYLARVLDPPVRWLRSRGLAPALAALAGLAAFFAAVGLIGWLVVPRMADEFSELGPTLTEATDDVEQWLVEDAPFDVSEQDKIGEIGAQGIVAGGAVFVASIAGFLGKFLVIIATVGQFFCDLASVTANSRMIYAFSRDNGLPGSNIWHKINPKTRTPTNSLWLGVGLSAVVGLLTLVQNAAGVPVAFFALTGICVVGLYISYVIPIYLRLTNPDFKQGPWNLGTRSKMIGWISVAWVFLIGILFVLPIFKIDFTNWETFYSTMNWTGPILVVSALAIWIWWKVSANKWFTGPKVQGTAEELAAIERELGAL